MASTLRGTAAARVSQAGRNDPASPRYGAAGAAGHPRSPPQVQGCARCATFAAHLISLTTESRGAVPGRRWGPPAGALDNPFPYVSLSRRTPASATGTGDGLRRSPVAAHSERLMGQQLGAMERADLPIDGKPREGAMRAEGPGMRAPEGVPMAVAVPAAEPGSRLSEPRITPQMC